MSTHGSDTYIVKAPLAAGTHSGLLMSPWYVCAHRDGTWFHTNGPCPGDACVFQRDADYYQAHKDDPEEWGDPEAAP